MDNPSVLTFSIFFAEISISNMVSFVVNSPLLTIEVPISVKSSSQEIIDPKRNAVNTTPSAAFKYFLNITTLSLLFRNEFFIKI